jgi:O-antigen/teichoic acid export membrane protein
VRAFSGLVTGVAVLALGVLAVPIVRILLSDAFMPVVPLLWVLAPGVMLYSGAKVLMAYFRGVNRPGICSWVVWIGLCVNVTMLFLLYPAPSAWRERRGRCRSALRLAA